MKSLRDIFASQEGGMRLGLVIGAVLIVAGTALAGYFLMRTDYQVLFSDLSPQDVGVMTGELDRLKVPYVLGQPGDSRSDGSSGTIMVDKNDVYRTRIKLMSKDIPLHGAIGFELFNNSDLGMTEFAQKINFQRALQGELTRTILSLSEVRDARVLLALPEQGLFKDASVKPTASVTLSLKPGQHIRPEQVNGIQRLVAAAVSGILAQDVTIVDESGVALTRPSDDDPSAASRGPLSGSESGSAQAAYSSEGSSSVRLDLKQDTENYLARKANAVLERALGPGTVTTSVDVTLNMDRVQTNTDEVLGTPGKPGSPPTGVVSKERDSEHEVGAPVMPATGAGTGTGTMGGSNQHEIEYALGRRVEQVVRQPGSIQRIQVAVVVHRSLTTAQMEQLRQTVGAAIGASFERGDTVVVQTTDGFLGNGHASPAPANEGARPAPDVSPAFNAVPGLPKPSAGRRSDVNDWLMLLAAFVGLAAVAMLLARLVPAVSGTRRLSPIERREALAKLRGWIAEGDGAATDIVVSPGAHR